MFMPFWTESIVIIDWEERDPFPGSLFPKFDSSEPFLWLFVNDQICRVHY